jgi:hypothetical protein
MSVLNYLVSCMPMRNRIDRKLCAVQAPLSLWVHPSIF